MFPHFVTAKPAPSAASDFDLQSGYSPAAAQAMFPLPATGKAKGEAF